MAYPTTTAASDVWSLRDVYKAEAGTNWPLFFSGVTATGGTVTDITDGDDSYRIHTFTSSGTFQVTSDSGIVEFLLVAGGGGGGNNRGGGGGAGGLIQQTIGVEGSTAYTITVGDGGAVQGSNAQPGFNGEDSAAFGQTAIGGGGGGGFFNTPEGQGKDGGSGGGGGSTPDPSLGLPGSGTPGQGFDGGKFFYNGSQNNAGGGGSASQEGFDAISEKAGDGGDGVSLSIDGTAKYYAGGGGGGPGDSNTEGFGGLGGGGDGATFGVSSGDSGLPNTGGGGGGGNANQRAGGAGGSGIVIVRYAI